jgi:WD40 repeat protein
MRALTGRAGSAPAAPVLGPGRGAVRGPELGNRFRFFAGVRCVAFAPDGRALAVAAGWVVKIWDVGDRALRYTLRGHKHFVWTVAFAPDGKTALSRSEDRTVRSWDVESGRAMGAYDWHAGKVRCVAFAPDGLTAAAGGDGDIVIWDVDGP